MLCMTVVLKQEWEEREEVAAAEKENGHTKKKKKTFLSFESQGIVAIVAIINGRGV